MSAAAAVDYGAWPVPVGSARAAEIVAMVRAELKEPEKQAKPKGRPATCECGGCATCRRREKDRERYQAKRREGRRKASSAAYARGLPDGDPRHGTTTGYRYYGCKCNDCQAADRKYRTEKRERRRQEREAERARRREEQFPLCACGCGERVATPGAKYRKACYHRSPEGRAQNAAKAAKRWKGVARAPARDAPLAPDDPRHGSHSGYSNHGCRCVPCTAANREAARERRERERAASAAA